MERLFLAWVASLAAASWVGITPAEAGAFTIAPAVAGGRAPAARRRLARSPLAPARRK